MKVKNDILVEYTEDDLRTMLSPPDTETELPQTAAFEWDAENKRLLVSYTTFEHGTFSDDVPSVAQKFNEALEAPYALRDPLTPNELNVFNLYKKHGRMTISELRDYLADRGNDRSYSAANQVVKSLERKGYMKQDGMKTPDEGGPKRKLWIAVP
jgi:hypothetical protein